MTEDQFKDILNQELAKFTGQLSHRFDQSLNKLRDELEGSLNRVHNTLDGLAGRMDTDEQERAAMSRQLRRHEGWHEQAAAKLGMNLDYSEQ